MNSPLNFLKSLDEASIAKASLLAIISLPIAFIYVCYKVNKAPAHKPLTIEEIYPDEHLGI
jgi:hypothetical protein